MQSKYTQILKRWSTLVTLMIAASTSVLGNFDFYGHIIDLHSEWRIASFTSTPTQQSIGAQLKELEAQMPSYIKAEFEAQKLKFNLDDMGMVIMVQKASRSLSNSKASQQLIQYLLLRSLGLDVQLTYSQKGLAVFGILSEQPARSVYLFDGGKRYTNLNFKDDRLSGTRRLYKDGTTTMGRKIKVEVDKRPKINAKLSKRIILWAYKDKYYRLNAVNNNSLTEYLEDIPVMKLGKQYVERPCSEEFEESVLDGLRTHLKSFSTDNEKVAFLLSFVQSAFRYQTDQEQFGKEKYNYPEQTLGSSFSDCEDRTVLLSYLCKRLLNFNSVGLYFEQDKHICLAIAIPGHSNSYSLKYMGVNYVVCEPTGIGFKVGETGIPLKRITEIIPLF